MLAKLVDPHHEMSSHGHPAEGAAEGTAKWPAGVSADARRTEAEARAGEQDAVPVGRLADLAEALQLCRVVPVGLCCVVHVVRSMELDLLA